MSDLPATEKRFDSFAPKHTIMENEHAHHASEEIGKLGNGNYFLPASIIISAVILAGAWIYTTGLHVVDRQKTTLSASPNKAATLILEGSASSSSEVVLPVVWGDLGARMAAAGVFDKEALLALQASQEALRAEDRALVDGASTKGIQVNERNARLLLNLFWALGLSNKNEILERGEMADPRYGGAGRFASTAGWTLARGDAMSHWSAHQFVTLTPDAQALVDRVSRNIYRPCCDNSTHFPDCNHGMAMLGLLELAASQGATEAALYRMALVMNSYWFPEQYATISRYVESAGRGASAIDTKEVLGASYSSASGFANVARAAPLEEQKSKSNACGV